MTQPPDYTRQFSFTAYQTENPADPLPGDELDGELNTVKATLDAINTNLELIQRDDGALANGSVGPAQLTAAMRAMISLNEFSLKGDWTTATAYAAADIVFKDDVIYVCAVAHTSGTFSTDLAASKWLALGGAASSTGFVPAGSVASTNVQDAIEELDAEKQPLDAQLTSLAALSSVANLEAEAGLTGAANKISYYTAAGAKALADFTAFGRSLVAAANAAAARVLLEVYSSAEVDTLISGVGGGSAVPVGSGMDYWGVAAPSGYLFAYGQAVSRTTYASLFTAIGTVYGSGDGSTTFNLPDKRGRASFGKDDMGGAAASRITNQSGGWNGDTLGDTGGAETHALVTGELAAHTHAAGTYAAASDGAHTHTVPIEASGADANPGIIPGPPDTSYTTASTVTSSSNGAHTHSLSGSSGSAGSGTAHNNLPPGIVCNYIIYAGV